MNSIGTIIPERNSIGTINNNAVKMLFEAVFMKFVIKIPIEINVIEINMIASATCIICAGSGTAKNNMPTTNMIIDSNNATSVWPDIFPASQENNVVGEL